VTALKKHPTAGCGVLKRYPILKNEQSGQSKHREFIDWKLLFLGIFAYIAASFPSHISLTVNDFPNQYHYIAAGRCISVPARIVAVAIDEHSLNDMPDRWPWRRAAYANLISALDGAGARIIALDIVFKGLSEDASDTASLSHALRSIKAKTILGYEFDMRNMAPGAIDASIPNDAYIPAMLDTPSDPDGFVRKMRVSYRFKGQSYYSMAVTAASAFLGKDPSVTASSIRTSIIQKRAGDIVYEDNFSISTTNTASVKGIHL